jgi:hypothetical protein
MGVAILVLVMKKNETQRQVSQLDQVISANQNVNAGPISRERARWWFDQIRNSIESGSSTRPKPRTINLPSGKWTIDMDLKRIEAF